MQARVFRTMNRNAFVALLLAIVGSCSDPSTSGSEYDWPAETQRFAGERLLAGSSLSDLWAWFERSGDIDNKKGLFRLVDGKWNNVPVPSLGAVLSTPNASIACIVSAGVGAVWIAGQVTDETFVLHISKDGTIEDHIADVPAASERYQPEMLAGGGGVFGLFRSTSSRAGEELLAHRVVDGQLEALVDGLLPKGAQLLLIVGADEAYFVVPTATSPYGILLYREGAWTDIRVGSDKLVRAAARSPGDVWFWAPPNEGGGDGFHGDGTTFEPFTVSGWPSDHFALFLAPTGPDRAAILTRVGTRTGSVSIDTTGAATAVDTLHDRAPSSSLGTFAFAVLADGTILVDQGNRGQWAAVRP